MDACRIGGFGHTRCYELIAAKILDARKAGSRTVITHKSLAAYIAGLPKLELGDGAQDAVARKRRSDAK
jgi:hypothetical protein